MLEALPKVPPMTWTPDSSEAGGLARLARRLLAWAAPRRTTCLLYTSDAADEL